jgi:SAM-dependent methyltransferase
MIDGEYVKHYKKTFYYPVWQHIVKYVRQIERPKILEIGCGAGQLAHFLYDEGFRDYRGIDIDPGMIKIARQNSGQDFFMADIKNKESYSEDYNTIIATEVLEHLENDLEIFKNLKKNVNFLFTLPSFKCNGHLRWFNSAPEITNYYFDCLYIKELKRLKNPAKWFIGRGITR